MKRLCAFVGILCLMLSAVALRLYFCRLNVLIDGEYYAFAKNDEASFCSISKGYERVDVSKETNVDDILNKLKAKIIRTEQVDEITIYYAYSPCLLKRERLFGENINLMIAITPSKIVVGSPLIKGSY